MLRLLASALAALALALSFPVMASASPDWTGSFVPKTRSADAMPAATVAPQTSVPSESDDEFPWMWLAIGSTVIAVCLGGVELSRLHARPKGHAASA